MSVRGRTWTALLLPPVSWFLFEQGLSAVLHADCARAGVGVVWGLGALLCCGVAFLMAWQLKRQDGARAEAWLAQLALVIAGIFALAITFQTLAILIVPACLR